MKLKKIAIFKYPLLGLIISQCLGFSVFAQNVTIEKTDVFKSGTFNGQKINKLLGNVKLRHKNMILFCDSAYQFVKNKNSLETFGRVKMIKSDTITLTCNKLSYNGATQIAKARNNVVLTDPQIRLTTEFMDFDLNNNQAYYFNHGKIVNDKNTLTSLSGTYYTNTKMMHFKDSVHLISPEREMFSDTMHYHTVTKIVYFKGPTTILTENGNIYTEKGAYDTENKISLLNARNRLENEEYILEADDLFFEQNGNSGKANGNVYMLSKKDNLILNGDHLLFGGPDGKSKLWGHTLMRYPSESDTLFMRADTLISISLDSGQSRSVLGFHKVRLFRKDLQGVCDSMVYNTSDSTLTFFKDPVLWTGENQITGDTISAQMANGSIEKMYVDINAFIISMDTLGNYNQVKGRHVIADFDSSFIKHINIDGNGESIYFALKEEDMTVVGMNRVICSNMNLDFADEALQTIHFLVQPDAKFIPPHELMEPDKKLRGFIWRQTEKPSIESIIHYEKDYN